MPSARVSFAIIGAALLTDCAADKGGGPNGSGGAGAGGAAGTTAAGGTAGSSGSSAGMAGSAGAAGASGSGGEAGTAGAPDASAGSGGAGAAGASGGPGDAGFDGPPADSGAPATVTAGAADRFLLIGTVLGSTGPYDGEVLVEGTSITCAAASCSGLPGASGATIVTTNGIIIPGLIDAHNHGLFNIFDEDDWTPTQLYLNHNQWTNEARYGEVVDAKQHLESTTGADLRCELGKYAEVKALIAGTTSHLMAPGATQPACLASVVRTIDTTHNDLPADRIQSSISVPDNSSANGVCNNFNDGDTTAYVVHVGEGIDTTSKNEFTTLIARGNMTGCNLPGGNCAGCLEASQTTIVHGTALGAPEFAIMATANMSLVWSPQSNVFLYGSATRIDLAIAAGVQKIALGPDWSLGGSVNMLDELRFADQYDDSTLGDVLNRERLFRMATIDSARALAVDQDLGSITVGKRADLAVIGWLASDPYDSLLATTPATMRMVMVDGRVLFGDSALIAAGPANPGCETLAVCGVSKFLCLAEPSTQDKLDQTFPEIKLALEGAIGAYETAQGIATLLPLAPLTKCP